MKRKTANQLQLQGLQQQAIRKNKKNKSCQFGQNFLHTKHTNKSRTLQRYFHDSETVIDLFLRDLLQNLDEKLSESDLVHLIHEQILCVENHHQLITKMLSPSFYHNLTMEKVIQPEDEPSSVPFQTIEIQSLHRQAKILSNQFTKKSTKTHKISIFLNQKSNKQEKIDINSSKLMKSSKNLNKLKENNTNSQQEFSNFSQRVKLKPLQFNSEIQLANNIENSLRDKYFKEIMNTQQIQSTIYPEIKKKSLRNLYSQREKIIHQSAFSLTKRQQFNFDYNGDPVPINKNLGRQRMNEKKVLNSICKLNKKQIIESMNQSRFKKGNHQQKSKSILSKSNHKSSIEKSKSLLNTILKCIPNKKKESIIKTASCIKLIKSLEEQNLLEIELTKMIKGASFLSQVQFRELILAES